MVDGGRYAIWIYVLALDIFCQQSGDICLLEVSVHPLGAGLGNVHSQESLECILIYVHIFEDINILEYAYWGRCALSISDATRPLEPFLNKCTYLSADHATADIHQFAPKSPFPLPGCFNCFLFSCVSAGSHLYCEHAPLLALTWHLSILHLHCCILSLRWILLIQSPSTHQVMFCFKKTKQKILNSNIEIIVPKTGPNLTKVSVQQMEKKKECQRHHLYCSTVPFRTSHKGWTSCGPFSHLLPYNCPTHSHSTLPPQYYTSLIGVGGNTLQSLRNVTIDTHVFVLLDLLFFANRKICKMQYLKWL